MTTAPVSDVKHGIEVLEQHLFRIASKVAIVVSKGGASGGQHDPAGQLPHGRLFLIGQGRSMARNS
ncbi:MAG: hypothetical protein HS126_24755 [Anaerolineales bacterium]|nr:hypothetical protein [Anaerolineales bacterium]